MDDMVVVTIDDRIVEPPDLFENHPPGNATNTGPGAGASTSPAGPSPTRGQLVDEAARAYVELIRARRAFRAVEMRLADVIDQLRLGGLTVDELAEELRVPSSALERAWRAVRPMPQDGGGDESATDAWGDRSGELAGLDRYLATSNDGRLLDDPVCR